MKVNQKRVKEGVNEKRLLKIERSFLAGIEENRLVMSKDTG